MPQHREKKASPIKVISCLLLAKPRRPVQLVCFGYLSFSFWTLTATCSHPYCLRITLHCNSGSLCQPFLLDFEVPKAGSLMYLAPQAWAEHRVYVAVTSLESFLLRQMAVEDMRDQLKLVLALNVTVFSLTNLLRVAAVPGCPRSNINQLEALFLKESPSRGKKEKTKKKQLVPNRVTSPSETEVAGFIALCSRPVPVVRTQPLSRTSLFQGQW